MDEAVKVEAEEEEEEEAKQVTPSGDGVGVSVTGLTPPPVVDDSGWHHMYVTVRLKPLDAEPHQGRTGRASERQISSWDPGAGGVTIGNHGAALRSFHYPVATLPPSCTQDQAYRATLPRLVEAFLQGFNVNFLAFGQTGSGKTYTMFGPPGCMGEASARLRHGTAGVDTYPLPQHGMFLRAAFSIQDTIEASEDFDRAALTATMVELHWDQVVDLLNDKAPCSIGTDHTVRGATMVPLHSHEDVVHLAAAVEKRTTNATLMNDTSSRAHCITSLTLTTRRDDRVTTRVFQFFDLMGSERAKGQNSAHDTRVNAKETVSGFEGIVANMSLSQFALCVQRVIENNKSRQRRANKKMKRPGSTGKQGTAWCPFRFMQFTRAVHKSFFGTALTCMVITLSQAPRNGNESYHSLMYGENVHKLKTRPKPVASKKFSGLIETCKAKVAEHSAALARLEKTGTNKKFVTVRRNEVARWSAILHRLELVC